MAWKVKTNCRGEMTNAVRRRGSTCSSHMTLGEEMEFRFEISSHEDRSEFGYCYLECVNDV